MSDVVARTVRCYDRGAESFVTGWSHDGLPPLLARFALVVERVLGEVKDDGYGLDPPRMEVPPHVMQLEGSTETIFRRMDDEGGPVFSNQPEPVDRTEQGSGP